MSVYSGFATRSQETTYNKFVFKTIQLFSAELLKLIQMPNTLETIGSSDFEKKAYKLHKAMKYMEQHKHLEPKFSNAFTDFATHIKQFNVSKMLI